MTTILPATTLDDLAAVRTQWTAYWNHLGFTPCFQNFGAELDSLPGAYAPPSGRLFLAWVDGQPAGAVAFRHLDDRRCEAKRLFVHPSFRGHKIGQTLMERLISEARDAGYKSLVGDTLPVMADALKLYDRMGFQRIASYPGATGSAICIEYPL